MSKKDWQIRDVPEDVIRAAKAQAAIENIRLGELITKAIWFYVKSKENEDAIL